MLWECGCSVTIQVRLCPSSQDYALARNQASEKLKTLGDESLSGTFLDFATMIQELKIEKVQDAEPHHLRFNNSAYNVSMHKAAMTALSIMNSSSKCFEKAMARLEMQWGRELLSNDYSKLVRLISIAKTAGEKCSSGPCKLNDSSEVAAWLVDMLHLALNVGLATPKNTTEKWLDKDRKHGVPGFWPASLIVHEACCFLVVGGVRPCSVISFNVHWTELGAALWGLRVHFSFAGQAARSRWEEVCWDHPKTPQSVDVLADFLGNSLWARCSARRWWYQKGGRCKRWSCKSRYFPTRFHQSQLQQSHWESAGAFAGPDARQELGGLQDHQQSRGCYFQGCAFSFWFCWFQDEQWVRTNRVGEGIMCHTTVVRDKWQECFFEQLCTSSNIDFHPY